MLTAHGDWMPLGNADEQKDGRAGHVEAWGRRPTTRSAAGTASRRACAGRFGNYVPPVLEALGLAEVEHNARDNAMRAL